MITAGPKDLAGFIPAPVYLIWENYLKKNMIVIPYTYYYTIQIYYFLHEKGVHILWGELNNFKRKLSQTIIK